MLRDLKILSFVAPLSAGRPKFRLTSAKIVWLLTRRFIALLITKYKSTPGVPTTMPPLYDNHDHRNSILIVLTGIFPNYISTPPATKHVMNIGFQIHYIRSLFRLLRFCLWGPKSQPKCCPLSSELVSIPKVKFSLPPPLPALLQELVVHESNYTAVGRPVTWQSPGHVMSWRHPAHVADRCWPFYKAELSFPTLAAIC